MGPHGLLTSSVTVEEGVVRIWREWLARMAGTLNTPGAADIKGKKQMVERQVSEDERVLWVDNAKNVGLRLKVKERRWRRDNPILVASEDEVAVSYDIEFEGKLLLRSVPLRIETDLTALRVTCTDQDTVARDGELDASARQ